MTGQRDYIEELTAQVIAGKKAGQSIADLLRGITAASFKSLRGGYLPAATPEAIELGIKNNIDAIYDRVDKVSFSGSEPVRLRG